MPFAISTIVAIKCMLSAGAFTLTSKSQKRHSFTSAAFGVLYSFSAAYAGIFLEYNVA